MNVIVRCVPNQTYGGSVTVAGLLTNQDIFTVVDKLKLDGRTIVLPREMYDNNSCDLLGAPFYEVGQRYFTGAITL